MFFMSSRVILRVSSILLLLSSLSSPLLEWLSWQISNDPHSISTDLYIKSSIGVVVIACSGLLAMSIQFRHERHWLGRCGVLFTVGGYILQGGILMTYNSYADTNAQWLSFIDDYYAYTILITSLGLVFWAMDLPPMKKFALIQKMAMGIIALMPFIQRVLFSSSSSATSFPVISMNVYHLLISLLGFTAWALLGISIWPRKETSLAMLQQPEEEEDFQLTVSPLHSSEQASL
jgi:hypothetical protein